ncbi:GntR family transcriptional regulator [Amaricoccus sp.]|uniref:GntR family transcriptional regulator n=1 Tax=Amaricoccus sp. TaxID=1872485 RepID=UPI001B429943|nr:GntR family transcriptional regulator [Amaricoccus sp.]MBP7003193.1 GntR family transcriptional regulator [Amaricoccus sp.]
MDPGGLASALAARIDDDAPELPRYRRLSRAIEAEIAEGRLRQGFALPGERDLAQALGVSRVTVRKALDELAVAGLLTRRHGARTEVSTRVEKALSTLTSFSEDMLARGIAPGFRWISREAVRATAAEATALGLPPGAAVWRLARVRTGDGRPIAREISTVPAAYLEDAALVEGSLYRALAARGALPVRAVQRIRAALPDAADLAVLDCAETTPILEAERRCFLAGGEVVELCRTRYRADVYDFVVELHR